MKKQNIFTFSIRNIIYFNIFYNSFHISTTKIITFINNLYYIIIL